MRIAALYDIHGNLPALEAVLAEIRRLGADRIVVGGDVVPGPLPREALERLRALDVPVDFIRGNGESAVLAVLAGGEPESVPERARSATRWAAKQLQPEDGHFLASWPLTARIPVEGLGDVLFCHATPRNNTEVFTRLTEEATLVPVFRGIDAPLVVCGHTHMQFDRTVGATRVVNAGSVGMPFGEPGACWLLLDPAVELRRTSYDREAAAARIRATSYPGASEFAERNVLQTPSEAEALEVFSKVELEG